MPAEERAVRNAADLVMTCTLNVKERRQIYIHYTFSNPI
jgi:hypothetical protein